jgi:hypothetical protein
MATGAGAGAGAGSAARVPEVDGARADCFIGNRVDQRETRRTTRVNPRAGFMRYAPSRSLTPSAARRTQHAKRPVPWPSNSPARSNGGRRFGARDAQLGHGIAHETQRLEVLQQHEARRIEHRQRIVRSFKGLFSVTMG